METQTMFEVWWYTGGEYDGCCGHQHESNAAAKKCAKETKHGWPGYTPQVVPQERVLEYFGRGERA